MNDDPLPILRQLIAIPSVNPMGRDVSGPEFFETRLTGYLIEFFERLGVAHQQIEVSPGRSNVIARFDNPGSRTTVLLDAHQDTVPTDGMTIDPFDPVVEEGRVYGRGACDVKGGMAAMLAAFARLVREQPSGRASVIVSCTCDEEATATGIRQLVSMWSEFGGSSVGNALSGVPGTPKRVAMRGDSAERHRGRSLQDAHRRQLEERAKSLISVRPDVAVVAEPTGLDVVVAHRGATRWKLRTTGRACHSSRPADGVNAIYRMAAVLRCLEEYAERLPRIVPPHPLCGPPTLSVGRIEGGASVNTVPDWCTIEIDRRIVPGEDGLAVVDHVAEHLRERLDFEVEMLPPWLVGEALSDEHNHPWADRLLGHIEAVAGPHAKVGVPYGTHASRIAAAGVPAVVFGPGSIAQAHTKDEWISIDELRQASEIYYAFCCAGDRLA